MGASTIRTRAEKSVRTTGRVASGNKTRTLGTQEVDGDPGPTGVAMKEHHGGLSSVTAVLLTKEGPRELGREEPSVSLGPGERQWGRRKVTPPVIKRGEGIGSGAPLCRQRDTSNQPRILEKRLSTSALLSRLL